MDTEMIFKGNFPNEKDRATIERSSVIASSFYIQWEENSTYQIQFVMLDYGTEAYNLLTPSSIITFQGQQFLVNSAVEDHPIGRANKTVVATHIFNECQWFRQREVKNGVLTYTPQSIMDFVFKDNPYNFTWEVVGDFQGQQIENLGNMSGRDTLSKIVEIWPDAIVFPNNKHIVIYQHDKFVQSHGNRLGHMYNSSEVKLTYDVSAVTNQVYCIGKAKDKPDGADDNTPTEYYFPPFLYTDNASVEKWTHGIPREIATISDDRFTDVEAMKRYVITQLVTDPPLTIEITTTFNQSPIPGDKVHLDIHENGLSTDVEVVSYTWYPWDKNTPNQVTLNSVAKTIFDYNNSIRNKLYADLAKRNQLISDSLAAKIKDQNVSVDPSKKKGDESTLDWQPGNLFVDTSSNNGDISVNQFKDYLNQGVKGIICKLTEGTGYTNPLFGSHKENAINAGLKFIGTYHLFHGDPVNEANYFLKNLQANNVDKNVLVIADIENTSNSTLTTNKAELTNQLKQFYDVLIAAGYTNTCDYASSSWFTSSFDSQGKYRWIANYSNAKPANADAWQFTDSWNGNKIDASYSYNEIFV
ncbi:phage tail protein [Fructilactobacillus lindneri]|nr:phage tail protein [Fructilactobacillus lindneri]POH07507.1 hypothetical protein BGL35_00060 [Fructilactobacillus lindneri]POH08580.1 hypothetical protein BGL36_00095 [Fructilactobacillus lindneri]POH24906.1 hypothetical protein BHU33_02665 [Fructilactobacillus lindneri DSM 20690 = JCM 11027]SKA08946.1 Glycosyl hydrolases family 25 [Fructilactobacillus lindneri DSM 20690 = JCM 11027]